MHKPLLTAYGKRLPVLSLLLTFLMMGWCDVGWGQVTGTFYSKPTGNLNVTNTWGTNTDGTGAAPANFTTAGQTFILQNNPTPTISSAWTVSGTGSKIVVGNGSSSINFTIISTVSGTIDVTNNATLTINTSSIPTLGTLSTGSTVVYNSTGAQTFTATNYYNLTSSSSGARTLPSNTTITIAGTFNPGTNSYTTNFSSYTIDFSSSSLQTIPPFTYYNITNSGNGPRVLASSGTINIAGTFNPGSGNYTVTGSTVNYTSATSPVLSSFTYNHLIINGGSGYSLAEGATLTILGNFSQFKGTFTVSNSASTGTVNIGGDFNLSGGNFYLISNSISKGANVRVSGNTTISGTGTLDMEHTTSSGIATFQTQDFTATSTALPIIDFGTGDVTNNAFNIKGNFRKSGTGTFTTTNTAFEPTGFLFNGSEPQTFSYLGTVSNRVRFVVQSGSTLVLTTDLPIGTNATVPASKFTVNGTLNLGTNAITGGAGASNPFAFTLAPGGTLITANTDGITSGTTGSIQTSGTRSFSPAANYTYSGTSAQATGNGLPSTVNDLTIANTAGVTLSSVANQTVTGTLQVNGMLIPNSASQTLNGGTLRGSGTVQVLSTSNSGGFTAQYGGFTTKQLSNLIVDFANANTAQYVGTNNFGDLKISNTKGVIAVGDVTVNGALMLTGGGLSISSNTLTLNDAVNGSGMLSGSTASSLIIGGNAGTLNFATGANTLKNLTVRNGASASLGTKLDIAAGTSGMLVVTGTGVLNTNGLLTIKSDASGTARVGTSTGTINGNITVERYIPAKPVRKWTLLASPMSTTVRNGWQQQLFVTGPGTGGAPCGNTIGNGGSTDKYNSNGFDDTQNDPSTIFTYDQSYAAGSTSYFTPIANTNVVLTPGSGYRVNIRGDRNIPDACAAQINYTGNAPAAGAVTLSVTGAYNKTASKALNFSAANRFTLVGNPYPSELSLRSILSDNKNVVNAKAWLYCGNPDNTGDVYTVVNDGQLTNGQYLPDANKVYTGNALTDVVLSSGEAFFVEALEAGDITFNEQQKTTVAAPGTGIYSRQAAPFVWANYARIHLLKQASTLQEMDNIIVRFKNNKQVSNAQYGMLDATSINTVSSSIASLKAGNRLAIQTRSLDFVKRDTVYLAVNAASGNYQLSFTEYEQFVKAKYIYLVDNYLHTVTDVKEQPAGYPFSITTDTLSRGNNRFMVVFSTQLIKAATTATAATPAQYVSRTIQDTAAISKVAGKVQFGIYPNPVQDQLHIQVQHPRDAHYQLKVLSAAGAVVMKKEGHVSYGTIDLSIAHLAWGTYIVHLYFNDGVHYSQKFMKQ